MAKIKKSKNKKLNYQSDYNSTGTVSPSNADGDKVNYNLMQEQGITGLTRFGPFVFEEFLKELQGRRGAATYREMADNDATIGAILYAFKSLLRTVDWHVESSGTKEEDKIAAEFVSSCFKDMDMSWSDIISDILSFLTYGWALLETNYKIRKGPNPRNPLDMSSGSKHNDGRIGWAGWSIRSQNTLWGWSLGKDNKVQGMIQLAPPDYKTRFISLDKALLFKTESNKKSPEGRSLLRSAFRSWYIKKNIEDIEAIGMEKDLNGIPVLWLPPEIIDAKNNPDASPEDKMAYESWVNIGTNLKRNEESCLIMPSLYDEQGRKMYDITTIANSSTRKQFDTDQIIKRYDRNIAMTLLADFLMLGTNSQGSFALSYDKTSMFKKSLNSILKTICDEINRVAIPRLIRLNNFEGLTDYPELKHGKLDEASLTELANYVNSLAGGGVLDTMQDLRLEEHVRDKAGLPPRPDAETYSNIHIDNGGGQDNE